MKSHNYFIANNNSDKAEPQGYVMNLRRIIGHTPILLTAADVIVENECGEILLQRRSDNGCWSDAGGAMELGESCEDTARRELLEETGLTANTLELLGVFSGKETRYIYPNGDEAYIVSVVYICRDYSGSLKAQESEVSELRWFSIDSLPDGISPPVKPIIRAYLEKRGIIKRANSPYTAHETERLILRPFVGTDLPALYEIMRKPEVMYAWEHGFTFDETQEWLARQQARYHGGYGLLAVCLKTTGALIGQAGLASAEINGRHVTEVSYIFDNSAWGSGYATEAAKALVRFAFKEREINRLHCAIRPENLPSIKVAERLGFRQAGEYMKHYKGKEMPHIIFLLEREGQK
ncbi:MAG: GNAT family N-acetyltransferase [Clostridiales bacterium]|jgi:RimJ/RimL family protein N-acetyltransferase/ADP-ribose pyrophosphatase YjhB (NUDIX family)|nr:GNAT family N-acetyltransferase [Clostridiales bacterium]